MGEEELETRRQQVRERVIRKGSPELFGMLLVLLIFGFVVYSSAPSWLKKSQNGESNIVQPQVTADIKLSLKNTTTEPEAAAPALSSPIPQEFNRSEFYKLSIVDDNQSTYWSNPEPQNLQFADYNEDLVSGSSSFKVVFADERESRAFAEHTYPEFANWGDPKYLSFWFKGDGSGNTYSLYVYFAGDRNRYVAFKFNDIYSGWQEFVFSTERNIQKSGIPDWSKVWRIKLVQNDRSYTGTVYFDDFAVWIKEPPSQTVEGKETQEERVYGMREPAVVDGLKVTLLRFSDRYEVVSYVGKKEYVDTYMRIDIRVKNTGKKEIKLAFTPYKPVLVDENGKIYDYYYVKVKTKAGVWIDEPDQLKLDVLYPGTMREGAIYFKPLVGVNVDTMKLILYLNNRKYVFKFSRW